MSAAEEMLHARDEGAEEVRGGGGGGRPSDDALRLLQVSDPRRRRHLELRLHQRRLRRLVRRSL